MTKNSPKPKTVALAFPGGDREVKLEAKRGRWVVTRCQKSRDPRAKVPWKISESRCGLGMPWVYEQRREAIRAADMLNLVAPDWQDERHQTGEKTKQDWQSNRAVEAILLVASRPHNPFRESDARQREICIEVVLGTRACPPGFCVEGIRKMMKERMTTL